VQSFGESRPEESTSAGVHDARSQELPRGSLVVGGNLAFIREAEIDFIVKLAEGAGFEPAIRPRVVATTTNTSAGKWKRKRLLLICSWLGRERFYQTATSRIQSVKPMCDGIRRLDKYWTASEGKLDKFLISLVLPRGIEPLFSP
jgi:hypothetical protein